MKHFLEHCLSSVQKAMAGLEAEVFVVDNQSADGSREFITQRFPFVQYIYNEQNVGFGRANNQAVALATGKYVLFLNPDTILPEDCFHRCIAFFEAHADCGALGVRMIDGSGAFLPESKRSFPSPATSFFKLTGLSALFPQSKLFNRYALGYLPEHENHEVDVLAGAFMMLSGKAIEATKGFNEAFFMYGEDVDLSYRIQKAGWKNYYFADSTIIHFKGESTKKGSLNYVRMFYQAMSVFVQQHYSSGEAKLFSFAIRIAIWARALLSLITGWFKKIGLPLLDAVVIYICFSLVRANWVHYVREGYDFDVDLLRFAIPGFTLVFWIAAFFSGIYDRLYKASKGLLSCISAIVIMLAVYSLLPEKFRFSRGVILTGGILSGITIIFTRWLLVKLKWVKDANDDKRIQQTIVVGTTEEYKDVLHILQQAGLKFKVLGRVSVNDDKQDAVGTVTSLPQLFKRFRITEIIFCEGYLSYHQIIEQMQHLPAPVSIRFFGHDTSCILGSDSKTTSGETVTVEGFYRIQQPYQQRMKRFTDVFFSFIMLITFPLQLLLIKKGATALRNAWQVFTAKKTWIGYIDVHRKLPALRPAVLTHYGFPAGKKDALPDDIFATADMVYAREYEWLWDVKIFLKNYRKTGG